MFCKHCGAQIPSGSRFCPECGQRLDDTYTGNNDSDSSYDFSFNHNGDRQSYYNQEQYGYNGTYTPAEEPGRGYAIACLVLGIISVLCIFTGGGAIISVVCGIIGLVLASNAKKAGYNHGIRTAGFVLSIIGLAVGAVVFIVAVVLIGRFFSILNGMPVTDGSFL